MARRARPIGGVALAAGALVAAAVLAPLAAVLARAQALPGAADWAALRFTLMQAALSAAISISLAVPVARALARRRFPGQAAVIALLGAPFILPVVVAVMGLIAIFGRAGPVSDALAALGMARLSIYGLPGILLANVFFNLPLAVRLVLQGWRDIPAERFRLAAALGFGPREVARHLERPMLGAVLPGTALAVFLICLSSFAIALTLGGGPRATTVELAIYQAFRFDFDPGRAAVLAAVQLGIGILAAGLALALATPPGFGAGLDRAPRRWDVPRGPVAVLDAGWIAVALAFLVLPLAALALEGATGIAGLPAPVWQAAARSLAMALASAALATGLAVALARARFSEGVAMLPIAASPLVLGTGLFLLIRPLADPVALALPVTVAVNALTALPFAVRALAPPLREAEATQGRLADSLGLTGWTRLRHAILPRIGAPLGFAFGLSAALAMGDLGVIALFADPERATLPLQVFRLMAAYRSQDAAAAAVLLMGLSFALFALFDRWGRRHAAT